MRLQDVYECVMNEIKNDGAVVFKDTNYVFTFKGFSQFVSDMIIEEFGGKIIESFDGMTFERLVEVYPVFRFDYLFLDQFVGRD